MVPSWGPERKVVWLCLNLRYFLRRFGRSASTAVFVVAEERLLCANNAQLPCSRWRRADKVKFHPQGHMGDEAQLGEVRAGPQDEACSPQSGYRANGGAVALMVERLSWHPTLCNDAPPSPYRRGSEVHVRVVEYDRASEALREVVHLSGRAPKHSALYPIRIGELPPSSWRWSIGNRDTEGRKVEVRCA